MMGVDWIGDALMVGLIVIFISIVESRIRGLLIAFNSHIALPCHTEVSTQIAVIENRVYRIELDVRNHNGKFDEIKKLIEEHNTEFREFRAQMKEICHGKNSGVL